MFLFCFVSLRRDLNVNVVGNVLGAEKWDGQWWANEKKDLEI